MTTRNLKETKDIEAEVSILDILDSHHNINSFPSDMLEHFRCQLPFNTRSLSPLKDIIIRGGIP